MIFANEYRTFGKMNQQYFSLLDNWTDDNVNTLFHNNRYILSFITSTSNSPWQISQL